MKRLINIFSAILILLFYFSCATDPEKKDSKKELLKNHSNKKAVSQNLNISFLLDLSDRINPEKYPNKSMEFYQSDAAYIKSASDVFEEHLRSKKVLKMNDKIQMYFDPAPQNQNINKISNQLKFHVTKDNASLSLLDKIKNTYSTKPLEIYKLAIKDDKYVGSDTWRFFKSKVKDYCIEEGYRNILIILTDGYIYHKNTIIKESNLTSYITPQDIRNFKLNKSNWEDKIEKESFGFIPIKMNLENLEVLVLGVNPDIKNAYEEDVIKKYWSDWLQNMKVKKLQIRNAGLPSDMDKLIKDFVLQE